MLSINRNKLLAVAAASMAEKDIRYYLNGVCLEIKGNQQFIVATNGHVVTVARQLEEYEGEPLEIIIPDYVVKAFKPTKGDLLPLTLTPTDDGYCLSEQGGLAVNFKPIDGIFPEWRKILPINITGEVAQFNTGYLAKFIKARRILRISAPESFAVAHNGAGGSLIRLCDDVFAIIMPFRIEVDTEVPVWATQA